MLTSTYSGGALEIRSGRNAWRVTGTAWVPGVAASMAARGCKPGAGRILGRLLNGRYDVEITRTARETADEKSRRELHENPGSASGFAAELDRRTT